MTIAVRRASAPDRFEITVDDVVAGRAYFVDHDGARVYFHTVVDDAYAGQGLGRRLVEDALEATRADGLLVMPVCRYVRKIVAEGDRWKDLVTPITGEGIAAIEALGPVD